MALTANELIEQNLWSAVTDDATMSGLIGSRFYPVVAVQNPPRHPTTRKVMAYGTYQRIGTPRERTHDGPSGLAHPRFQLNWVGGQNEDGTVAYDVALEVAMEARKLLDGFQGTLTSISVDSIELVDERDRYEDGLELMRIEQDYIIWHQEALS